jgi:uncharacterized membrane protein
VFALVGDQLFADRFSVIVPVPVFLTYTVCVAFVPAATEPQLIELKALVQALSEYVPMVGEVVIVPVDETSLVIVIAARVVTVNDNATTARIIGAILVIFEMLNSYTCTKYCVLSLNKDYLDLF